MLLSTRRIGFVIRGRPSNGGVGANDGVVVLPLGGFDQAHHAILLAATLDGPSRGGMDAHIGLRRASLDLVTVMIFLGGGDTWR